jgi:magnesium-transporting ATPase (P-type)
VCEKRTDKPAIHHGLSAVLTLTLALGVERMAKRKAVVRLLVSAAVLLAWGAAEIYSRLAFAAHLAEKKG